MQQAISRILIAVAMVALVSYAATYAPLIVNRDIGSESLKDKAVELGAYLMDESPKLVYGISTGSRTMTSIKFGESNITLSLAGDTLQWYVPKNALFVKGVQFASPPTSEVSSNTSDALLFYSTSDGFYIQPKVMVIPPVTTSDISNTTIHFLSIRTCYLSDVTSSGLFDILKEGAEITRHTYERVCLYDGIVEVYVNGVNCLRFEVNKGEKLLVESLHYNIKLITLPRG